MFSYLLKKNIDEKTAVPCYFLHGTERFLANQFVDDLKASLVKGEDRDCGVLHFDLNEKTWMDVIDAARTIPFFLTSWRLIVIETPASALNLAAVDRSLLQGYLISPTSQTVLVVFLPGKLNKSASILNFFSSMASSSVCVKELRALKDHQVGPWIDDRLERWGKRASPDAKMQILEMVGTDLSRIDKELEKVAAYIGDKKTVEADDVSAVSGWVKAFTFWSVSDALQKGDYRQSLVALDRLLNREMTKPELLLGSLARFFRDIFVAKAWLREKAERKVIFRKLRPQILEKYSFYNARMKEFFDLTEKLSFPTLRRLLSELDRIDIMIKTSDISPQALLEGFLYDYFSTVGEGIIWKPRR